MSDDSVLHKHTIPAEVIENHSVSFLHENSFVFSSVLGKLSVGTNRTEHRQAVVHPTHEVLFSMPRSGVDAARAFIKRHVLAADHPVVPHILFLLRHLLEQRVLVVQPLELLPPHRAEHLVLFDFEFFHDFLDEGLC